MTEYYVSCMCYSKQANQHVYSLSMILDKRKLVEDFEGFKRDIMSHFHKIDDFVSVHVLSFSEIGDIYKKIEVSSKGNGR